MNKTSTLVVSTLMLALPYFTLAQYSPGLTANFGIDGDVISGYRQNGSFNAGSTDDWFLKSGNGQNLGKGVIDTTDAQNLKTILATGANYTFTRGMMYPRFSEQYGYLMLDARYGRDEYGYSVTSGNMDYTTYTNGAKNGANPSSWSTSPNGATVQNKSDIIDTYIHMRRNGTIINNTNPSPLILALGVSTVGNTGERYVDFELFRSRVEYNTTTGLFSNSGSALTGGHSAWEFNADGTIKNLGDISVSFSFGNGVVSEIAIYIWTSSSAYNSLNPARFNFVPGEFWGDGNNPTWGYAKILPDGGSPSFNAWGAASTSNYNGPVWGTNSKSIGNTGTNYYSTQYDAGDFAEVGIDLTSIGIDPALSVGQNPCSPPYTRVMAKTRSSSSFTSALMDFTGPYLFLDAPTGPSKIIPPATITCNQPTTTLSAKDIIADAVYQWSTTDGTIISDPNQPTITVDKAGKYFLTAAIVAGCNTNTDSTIVTADYFKPVASASVSGTIDLNNSDSYVSLIGGNVAASQYTTPFGGSVGLTWKWTGPDGGLQNSTNRVAKGTAIGTFTLEVTETRNGCKDIAVTEVLASPLSTLPVKIKAFTAVKKENDKVLIKWETADETPKNVELMRSFNGVDFSTITYALVDEANANKEYDYLDNVSSRTSNRVYYKLKITENSGAVKYSWIINILYDGKATVKLSASPNPATNYTVLSITSENTSTGALQVVDMSGRILHQKGMILEKGTNQVMLNEVEKLKKGMYIIRIVSNGESFTQKLIKSD
jgi:hypothetical protein